MDFLNNSNLHHAYLLVGRPEDFLPKLRLLLSERLGLVNLLASPDYIEESYSLFGIKDSHSLRQRQILSAFGQNGRFFVLTIDSATIEAQNALLKTFEEPTKGTHFFVILRSEDVFLPTLKSRFFVIRSGESRGSQGDDGMVASFLKLSPVARLEYVKKILSETKQLAKVKFFVFWMIWRESCMEVSGLLDEGMA
jgi:hypothetical protein